MWSFYHRQKCGYPHHPVSVLRLDFGNFRFCKVHCFSYFLAAYVVKIFLIRIEEVHGGGAGGVGGVGGVGQPNKTYLSVGRFIGLHCSALWGRGDKPTAV